MKAEFIKFPSLVNHYKQDEIDYFFNQDLYGKNDMWVVSEKIDGANFQIIIDKESIRYASRNGLTDNSFFNCVDVMSRYKNDFVRIQNSDIETVNIFGEIYGDGIQRRVKYCDGRDFRVFALYVNGVRKSFFEMLLYFSFIEVQDLEVVPLFMDGTFDECMAFDIDIETDIFCYNPKGNRKIEGVVISPYHKGIDFAVKLKQEKFRDRRNHVVISKEITDANLLLEKLKNEFNFYINQNRLDDLFSKNGTGNFPQDLGKYISLMLQDAKDDFIKDYEESIKDLPKEMQGKIYTDCGRLTKNLILNNKQKNG